MIQVKKKKCSIEDQIFSFQSPEKPSLGQKFRRADQYLSEQYQPQSILCRQNQIEQIKKFVRQFLETGHSKQSLYISGFPGIGKTLSVHKAFSDLEKDKQIAKNIQKQKIKIIRLNAIHLKHPSDIYKNMYLQLTSYANFKKKKIINSQNAMVRLDGIFRKNQVLEEDEKLVNTKKVILIDEIDYLKNRQEDILYNIFDWTQSQNSKLAIIAISNTLNFPQLLKPKILSRIGNRRIIFKPYPKDDLQKILNQRVEQTGIFDKNLIAYISRRIAKCSSDIRKCFQILRKAMFIHAKTTPHSDKIKMQSVMAAYDEIYQDNFTHIYKSMPINYKKVLLCLSQYSKEEARMMTLQTLAQNMLTRCKMEKQYVKQIVINLMEMKVVQIKHTVNPSSNTKFLKQFNVKLEIEYDKVLYASLKHDSEQIMT